MKPLVVTFAIDGAGCVYYPSEPPHLDGLLSWAWRVREKKNLDCDPDPSFSPEDAVLPIGKRWYGTEWVWASSVLIPCGDSFDGVQWARRRADIDCFSFQNEKKIYTDNGITKSTQRPWPLVIVDSLRAYCIGDRKGVLELASMIRSIGAERGRGKGQVVSVDVSLAEDDWSCVSGGCAMRYIPDKKGARMVRPRPPYWHGNGQCSCLIPGDVVL